MTTTIVQNVVFNNTTTKVLYNLYMNAKQHSIIADSPVTISEKEGSEFNAFDGYIIGKTLHLIKDRLIVQSWRGSDWNNNDVDSTFIINLEQKGNDVILHAIHANVPEEHSAHLETGWYDNYWNPYRQHLEGKTITRPVMHTHNS